MHKSDLEIGALFTTNGEDIWQLEWYCMSPMCKLRNLRATEGMEFKEMQFGIGGITAERFKRIKLVEVVKDA